MTALIIIVVVAAITGWLVIRGGFSARDNPSWIEKAVARTARSMAVPTTAREMKDPVQNTPENLSESRSTLGGPLRVLPREQRQWRFDGDVLDKLVRGFLVDI